MKIIFDTISAACSKKITQSYSTSFTLGIQFLDRKLHKPIYNIYGLVRCADEIVDSFHQYDKNYLLNKYKTDALEAIEQRISLNPVLNSFQETANRYNIGLDLLNTFFESMEMDLEKKEYSKETFDKYILGSAEVVGLMCLKVFTEGDILKYEKLKPYAMKLGSAFQKVNFLRDIGNDINELGRFYFPKSNGNFTSNEKNNIEKEIEEEFKIALEGIRMLPLGARRGVYLAYSYYINLFRKIKKYSAEKVLLERVRLPASKKLSLMFNCILKEKLNYI